MITMGKTHVTLSISQDIHTAAKQEYDNLSAAVENLLADDMDHDTGPEEHDRHLVKESHLTGNKAEAARLLLSHEASTIKKQRFAGLLRDHGVYQRPDYIAGAVDAIVGSDLIPYTAKGENLVPQNVEHGCGAEFSASVLSQGGGCPGCGGNVVDLKQDRSVVVDG